MGEMYVINQLCIRQSQYLRLYVFNNLWSAKAILGAPFRQIAKASSKTTEI